MSFCIRAIDTKARPEILCDACEKPVDDWKLANVVYRDWPSEAVQDFRVVHKSCGKQKYRDWTYWMTLQDFLGWLLWNKKWGEIPIAPVQKSESPIATDFLMVPITRPVELF